MQTMPIRIFLVLFIIILIYPSSLIAATERRTALVIGNGSYEGGPLINPANDATDMAAKLKSLDFDVILKKNSHLQDIEEAMEEFGNRLKRGGVGLFYFAGHGVQIGGVNYLLPIGVKVRKESDVRYQAIDANRILDEMANANNGLNIVILDACRDNPYGRNFRNASRGLAIISAAPEGTFISYATGPGQLALDGSGRNSPYTEALMKNMTIPGLPIEQVFKNVRVQLTPYKQTPWEMSSLKGDFYFKPSQVKSEDLIRKQEAERVIIVEEKKQQQQEIERKYQELERQEALQSEQRKMESEQVRLAEEKKRQQQEMERKRQESERQEALKVEQKNQEAEQVRLVEGKKQLAMLRPSSTSKFVGEAYRDGRFISYDNGTVVDTNSNLMWAAMDNGKDVEEYGAKKYCENYRGGGYTDWRMPTKAELAGLFGSKKEMVTDLIKITKCCPWPSDYGREEGSTDISNSSLSSRNKIAPTSFDSGCWRALPVRHGIISSSNSKDAVDLSIKAIDDIKLSLSLMEPNNTIENMIVKENEIEITFTSTGRINLGGDGNRRGRIRYVDIKPQIWKSGQSYSVYLPISGSTMTDINEIPFFWKSMEHANQFVNAASVLKNKIMNR